MGDGFFDFIFGGKSQAPDTMDQPGVDREGNVIPKKPKKPKKKKPKKKK
jgi:hypothetical protein